MRQIALSSALVCALGLAAGACGPAGSSSSSATGTGGSAGAGAGGSAGAGAVCSPFVTGFDDMPHNDMPHNDLSTSAIAESGALLALLAQSPLTDATFTAPSLESALADPASRELMGYLVSCALNGADTPMGSGLQSVKITYPTSPAMGDGGTDAGDGGADAYVTLDGELGLCGTGSPAGDWGDPMVGHASEECLELVSACLLARVNAVHERVILSVRGDPTARLPLRDRVRVETQYREDDGTPIWSFEPCSSTSPAGPPDCGWQPHYVGRCKANTSVTLTASTLVQDAAQLRVCTGLYGCNSTPSVQPAPNPPPDVWPPDYGGQLVQAMPAGGGSPGVKFTCPTSPVWPIHPSDNGTRYAYYSVMVDGVTSDQAPQVQLSASDGGYPATEAQVFTWQEGAFYGDVFPGPIGKGQYACFSDIWNDAAAHMNDRLCDTPTGSMMCGVIVAGACRDPPPVTPPPMNTDRCQDEVACDGHYQQCTDQNATMPAWAWPITVWLNHPCDLSAKDGSQCFGSADPQITCPSDCALAQ